MHTNAHKCTPSYNYTPNRTQQTHFSVLCWSVSIPLVVLFSLLTVCVVRMYTVMAVPELDACIPLGVHHNVAGLDSDAIHRFQQVVT